MRHISLLAVSLLALAACTPEKQQEADDYTQYMSILLSGQTLRVIPIRERKSLSEWFS